MSKYSWDPEKDKLLLKLRKISFSDIVSALESNTALAIKPHHNHIRYPNQLIAYVYKNKYVYACPFIIQSNGEIFFKMIYPTRKVTKQYIKEKHL